MIIAQLSEFKHLLRPDSRVMGLDVGTVRIGCAASNINKILASGICLFNLKKQKFTTDVLKAIIERETVYGIVVGYPIQMDGTIGESCLMIENFIKKYLLKLEQPIFLQDERLSSAAVNRYFTDMQLTRKQKAELIDEASARYILQIVLDKMKLGV